MPFNYLLTLNYILSSIILCLSVALLKVVHQMTGFLTSQSENAENAVIRGLIIARGPRGATLQDIKRDFMDEMDRDLCGGGEYAVKKRLEGVPYITAEVIDGRMFYFAKAPRQKHLVKLIRNQRTRAVDKSALNSPRICSTIHQNFSNQSTPKTCAKILLDRRAAQAAFRPNTTAMNLRVSFSRIVGSSITPSDDLRRVLTPPQAPRKPAMNDISRCMDELSEKDQNHNSIGCNNSLEKKRFCQLNDEVDPFMPEFFNCILIGDNFFLNLAMIDMGFRFQRRDRLFHSGHCVSGLTIAEATRNIERIPHNQMVLLNVGSIDIVHGKELVELVFAMMRLFRNCLMNNITPIITTLAPLANYRLDNRVAVMKGFNDFLLKNPFNFPVIELHKNFLTNDGLMDINCYQQAPRHVSGMKKPLVFWSRMGHLRVMRTLKQELGSAILKIMLK